MLFVDIGNIRTCLCIQGGCSQLAVRFTAKNSWYPGKQIQNSLRTCPPEVHFYIALSEKIFYQKQFYSHYIAKYCNGVHWLVKYCNRLPLIAHWKVMHQMKGWIKVGCSKWYLALAVTVYWLLGIAVKKFIYWQKFAIHCPPLLSLKGDTAQRRYKG